MVQENHMPCGILEHPILFFRCAIIQKQHQALAGRWFDLQFVIQTLSPVRMKYPAMSAEHH
eukprot:12157204-Prorocentrum_lima.AAC.1